MSRFTPVTRQKHRRHDADLRAWMQSTLDAAALEHGVPAASMAVAIDDDIVDVATGVLNLRTGVAASVDSAFQIGSVTKVFTAALVMQLVGEGRVDLDATVIDYLENFTTADPQASRKITIRQLLSHTAGFEGDLFIDMGRGEDAIAKLVGRLSTVDQVSEPGELFSYSNAGFVVLGRVIEVLSDRPFETVLRRRLLEPLGLTTSATSADEAILGRPAVGHLPAGESGQLAPATVWALPWSNAPAGATLSMSAGDLARFGQVFLRQGLAESGSVVLSPDAVARMQEEQVSCPDLGRAPNARGLGWGIYHLPEGPMLGHDGGTVGQFAFLRVIPGRNIAVSMLANGGNPTSMRESVLDTALRELAEVAFASVGAPAGQPMPVLEPYVGTYRSGLFTMTVSSDDVGRLWLEVVPRSMLAQMGLKSETSELLPVGEDLFAHAERQHERFAFVGRDDSGRARFLHTGRAHVRVQ